MGLYSMHSRNGLVTDYLGDEWFDLINAYSDEAKRLEWSCSPVTRIAGHAGLRAVSPRRNGEPETFGLDLRNRLPKLFPRLEDACLTPVK